MTGVILNMDERQYHADPALSSTGARLLLDSPARFRHYQEFGRPEKDEFDIGHAAHALVLGVGMDIDVIPDDVLASNGATSTKAAKEFIADSRSAGRVPLKSGVARRVYRMADAALAHPLARVLLEKPGASEVSVFGVDPETGVKTRCRFDRLADPEEDGRRFAIDLKTGASASLNGFAKSVASWRYDVQQGFYEDTAKFAGMGEVTFLFIVVETEPPHLTAVHQLSLEFRDMGREDARKARRLFAECTKSGVWPGYPEEIGTVVPPNWLFYERDQEEIAV